MHNNTAIVLGFFVGWFGATTSVAQAPASGRVLTSLAQVHDRLYKNDTTDYEVDLTASVNYWDRGWTSLFVQSGDDAVFVELNKDEYARVPDLALGDVLRIKGKFNPRRYVIYATSIQRVAIGRSRSAIGFLDRRSRVGG